MEIISFSHQEKWDSSVFTWYFRSMSKALISSILSFLLKEVFSSSLLINMSYCNVDAQELRTNSTSITGSELTTEAVAPAFLWFQRNQNPYLYLFTMFHMLPLHLFMFLQIWGGVFFIIHSCFLKLLYIPVDSSKLKFARKSSCLLVLGCQQPSLFPWEQESVISGKQCKRELLKKHYVNPWLFFFNLIWQLIWLKQKLKLNASAWGNSKFLKHWTCLQVSQALDLFFTISASEYPSIPMVH